ncbi:RagB/SusD family nutrient uptake outer membrane protein [Dysgonomonas sp. GY75]|uniref:RagB/SusD family nutrient uptake outer membrane protein n=1 Tax=Dysgonomonas sp. GY75 TaxID=2780419 RepID=UPI0018846823|nr:RagB/SusD family nutrient uptake outer membrane protein [Dysgonomonas sp. GY75]MBF0648213.1 RagB/SusD family nutrient uptake outer membrane protein [Dysgonomonas sp. GY75]
MFSNLYNKLTLYVTLIGTVCSLMMSSCNDFLDVESKHIAKEDQQWETLEDTRAALMGIYGLMRAALAENNTHWICGDLRTGDFSVTSRLDLQAIVDNDLNQPHSLLDEISNWRRFYAVINAASLFIEKAPRTFEKDKSYSEENLNLDIAQARAIRAFAYFYMVRIWGDVPLVTYSYDNGSFPEIGKTEARVVLNYAKEELIEAIKILPFEFGTSTSKYYGKVGSDWRGILLNKISAYTILAHISAWEGNYVDVETYTTFVMNNATKVSATYISVEDLTSSKGMFTTSSSSWKGCRLLSFTFPFNQSEATQTGHLEYLTLASPIIPKSIPDIYVTKERLFAIFNEVDDKRFGINPETGKYYTNYVQNIEFQYPVFSKIKVIQDGSPLNNDYAVFGSAIVFSRLEEITLLRAEALCALNRPAEAIIFLNTIRTARGLSEASYKKDFAEDKTQLVQAIFMERKKELIGEGWLWYDSIRRQKLLKDDPLLDEIIVKGGIYWPVSQDVLMNSKITQNTYWQ